MTARDGRPGSKPGGQAVRAAPVALACLRHSAVWIGPTKGRCILATVHSDELLRLAATLDEAKQEINLARQQSTKPNHLFIRATSGGSGREGGCGGG